MAYATGGSIGPWEAVVGLEVHARTAAFAKPSAKERAGACAAMRSLGTKG
jgi:hypothetical protein